MLDYSTEVAILSDEFERGLRSDTFYRLEIVATQQNAQVNELDQNY